MPTINKPDIICPTFEYAKVWNLTAADINKFKVVRFENVKTNYALGMINIPSIAIVSSYDDIPVGVVVDDFIDSRDSKEGRIIRWGVITTSLNTSGASLKDPVYSDNAGDLTLTPTPLKIGQVASLAASGKVMVNAVRGGDFYLDTQVTKSLYVDKNRTDSYVENGSITKPYKTIQAAITAASAGTVIEITIGTYTENLTLKSGVHLKGVFSTSIFGGVTIVGKATCSFTSGSIMLSGLYFYNTIGRAFEFIGVNAQKMRAYYCKFETNSGGKDDALLAGNTNAGSEIFLQDCLVQVLDSSGGANCISTNVASAGSIGLDNTSVRISDNIDNVAIILDGTISYWHRMDEIRGRVTVATNASCNLTLEGLYSSTQPVLTTNSAGNTVLTNIIATSTASPIITGAGVFIYSAIGYGGAGTGLAATLNGGAGAHVGAITGESAYNTLYDNAASNLAATTVKTALDEIALNYILGTQVFS